MREPDKCILCGDCVRMCNEVQHVGAIDFAGRGADMVVSPAFGRDIAQTECVNCGQCAAVCPTGAITIKKDIKDMESHIFSGQTCGCTGCAGGPCGNRGGIRSGTGQELHR